MSTLATLCITGKLDWVYSFLQRALHFQQSRHLPHSFLLFIYHKRYFYTHLEDPITLDNLTKLSALICEMFTSFKLHTLVTSHSPEMSVNTVPLCFEGSISFSVIKLGKIPRHTKFPWQLFMNRWLYSSVTVVPFNPFEKFEVQACERERQTLGANQQCDTTSHHHSCCFMLPML